MSDVSGIQSLGPSLRSKLMFKRHTGKMPGHEVEIRKKNIDSQPTLELDLDKKIMMIQIEIFKLKEKPEIEQGHILLSRLKELKALNAIDNIKAKQIENLISSVLFIINKPKEKRLESIIKEINTTEKTFSASVTMANNQLKKTILLLKELNEGGKDVKQDDIKFLSDYQKKLSTLDNAISSFTEKLGNASTSTSTLEAYSSGDEFVAYVDAMIACRSEFSRIQAKYAELKEKYPEINDLDTDQNILPFAANHITYIQRLPRHELLIKDIIKTLGEHDPRISIASAAADRVSKKALVLNGTQEPDQEFAIEVQKTKKNIQEAIKEIKAENTTKEDKQRLLGEFAHIQNRQQLLLIKLANIPNLSQKYKTQLRSEIEGLLPETKFAYNVLQIKKEIQSGTIYNENDIDMKIHKLKKELKKELNGIRKLNPDFVKQQRKEIDGLYEISKKMRKISK